MTWQEMPTGYGWYFFTPKLDDWDLALPVGVSRLEYGDGAVEFRATLRGERTVITPGVGWWFGPVRIRRPAQS